MMVFYIRNLNQKKNQATTLNKGKLFVERKNEGKILIKKLPWENIPSLLKNIFQESIIKMNSAKYEETHEKYMYSEIRNLSKRMDFPKEIKKKVLPEKIFFNK